MQGLRDGGVAFDRVAALVAALAEATGGHEVREARPPSPLFLQALLGLARPPSPLSLQALLGSAVPQGLLGNGQALPAGPT